MIWEARGSIAHHGVPLKAARQREVNEIEEYWGLAGRESAGVENRKPPGSRGGGAELTRIASDLRQS